MHRRFVLALLAVCIVAACSKDKQPSASPKQLKSLTVDEVAQRLAANDGKTFIYDNNTQESWVKGHVPGAKWLDDESVTVEALPPDKAATLIFYCHNES